VDRRDFTAMLSAVAVDTLRIRTPEGVEFALPLAGPFIRLMAWLVDFLVLFGLTIVLTFGAQLFRLISAELASTVNLLSLFIVPTAYGFLLEWYGRGRTIGKRVFRLRVVDAQGLKLTFGQVVLRNLLRAVDFLPAFYFVGGVTSVLSRRCQRLGDIAAGTVVIRQPKATEPDLRQLLAGRFNSLRTQPHLAARLRQRLGAAEASLALQALLRRDELDPAARIELYRDLADRFRAEVEFPPEVVEGLSDEQYIRDVVDILYRTKVEPST